MSNLYSNKLYYCVILTQFLILLYFYGKKIENSTETYIEPHKRTAQMQTFLKNSEIVLDSLNIQNFE